MYVDVFWVIDHQVITIQVVYQQDNLPISADGAKLQGIVSNNLQASSTLHLIVMHMEIS